MWRRRSSGGGFSSGLLLKAALDYARLGWSVIPIEPKGHRPLIPWQVHQGRRADIPEIGEWFRRWPEANLGVVTGVVSGIVVLDLDPARGGDASLELLQQRHGALPETVAARTGGDGRQLYFAHPGEILRNRVGLIPGGDLRGDGGYVVVPPSLHAAGELYRWECSPEVCRLAPLPDWLEALSQAPGEPDESQAQWRRLLRDGVDQDARGDTIAALAAHLLAHGVDSQVTTELLLAWNSARCRPPLEPQAVVAAVESITRLHRRSQDGDA